MSIFCEACGEAIDVDVRVTVTPENKNMGRFRIEGVAPKCPECGEWQWHIAGSSDEETA